jgi:signal peptidase I
MKNFIRNFFRREGGKFYRILFIIILVVVLHLFVFQGFRGIGVSMKPTLDENGLVIVNKLVYNFRKPARGEVIVFRTKDRPYVYFIKRIVALEGEIVEIKDGQLYINRREQKEPYLVYESDWNIEPFTVKKGCVFVVGDNRRMPSDEHLFTQVAEKNIIGRVIGVE